MSGPTLPFRTDMPAETRRAPARPSAARPAATEGAIMKRPWKVTVAAVLSGAGLALDAQAAVTRYEAETAPVTCGGTVAANHSGYSGTGFCDVAASVGAAVQLSADAAGGTAAPGRRMERLGRGVV